MRKYTYDEVRVRKRRRLPHWDVAGALYFVTFRLFDAVPLQVIRDLTAARDAKIDLARKLDREDRKRAVEIAESAYRREVERIIDAGDGSCFLMKPEIAKIVDDAIRFFDGERYLLLASTVMPNHVHVSYQSIDGWSLDRVLHSWKSYTGTECNRTLGRRGSFWDEEFFDRVIRDSRELQAVTRYVAENAQRADLRDWPWVHVFDARLNELM